MLLRTGLVIRIIDKMQNNCAKLHVHQRLKSCRLCSFFDAFPNKSMGIRCCTVEKFAIFIDPIVGIVSIIDSELHKKTINLNCQSGSEDGHLSFFDHSSFGLEASEEDDPASAPAPYIDWWRCDFVPRSRADGNFHLFLYI